MKPNKSNVKIGFLDIEFVAAYLPFLDYLNDKRKYDTIVFKGGRLGGKTYQAALAALLIAGKKKRNITCCSPFGFTPTSHQYRMFKELIHRYDMTDYNIERHRIVNVITGSIIEFVMTNCHQISNFEFVNSDIVWVDEGQTLNGENVYMIKSLCEYFKKQLWITYAPPMKYDHVFRHVYRMHRSINYVRHINFDENPFISKTVFSDYIKRHIEYLYDELISPEEFSWIWFGNNMQLLSDLTKPEKTNILIKKLNNAGITFNGKKLTYVQNYINIDVCKKLKLNTPNRFTHYSIT